MGYFKVRYDSRIVFYDQRGFIRLATDLVWSEILLTIKKRKWLKVTFRDPRFEAAGSDLIVQSEPTRQSKNMKLYNEAELEAATFGDLYDGSVNNNRKRNVYSL